MKEDESATIQNSIDLISMLSDETEPTVEEDQEQPTEDKDDEPGGYGTIKSKYGISQHITYVDYDALFDHLGAFKAQNSLFSDESYKELSGSERATEATRDFVPLETVDKAIKHAKYFTSGELASGFSPVPPAGTNIDAKEWEHFLIMSKMSVYAPLLALMWRYA